MSQLHEEKNLENILPLLLETIEEDDAKLDVEGEHLLLTNTHNKRSKAVNQTAVETSRTRMQKLPNSLRRPKTQNCTLVLEVCQLNRGQDPRGEHSGQGCGVSGHEHGGDDAEGVHVGGGVPSALTEPKGLEITGC